MTSNLDSSNVLRWAAALPLSTLVQTHKEAFDRLNAANEADQSAAIQAERDAARRFVEYTPASHDEARAKAAYVVAAGDALTAEDRDRVIASFAR